MEILIFLVYLIFFLIGDFIGKADKRDNIDMTTVQDNIVFSLSMLGFIFITLAIGIYFKNINNSVMSFLLLGLGLGFEKGQGKFDDFSWLLKAKN